MIGLDVTHKVTLSDEMQQHIRNHNDTFGDFLYEAGKFYTAFYMANRGVNGCYMHDTSAIAYTINPNLFDTVKGPIRVAIDGVAKGQTILKNNNYTYPENHWDTVTESLACMGVDEQGVLDLYEKVMID